jgi:hypothetical protein
MIPVRSPCGGDRWSQRTRLQGPCGHKVHSTSAIKVYAGMKALSSLRLVCLRCAGKDIETTMVYSGEELKGFLQGGLLKCLLTT